MSKKDELREGLMSTFLPSLPASELEKAKNLVPGENRPDVIVGGEEAVHEPRRSAARAPAVAERQKPAGRRDPIRGKQPSEASGVPSILRNALSAPAAEGFRYESFRPHTYRLEEEQIDCLNRIEAEILRNGVRKKERVTNNSILRCLVDVLQAVDLDVSDISSEADLKRRIFAKCGLMASQTRNKIPSSAS